MTPLAGLRVLDFSKVLAGPLCAQWLGDLGADVTKIEPPNGGDDTRGWPPFRGGGGAVFLGANRNKISLTLDLKTEAARQAARRMVAQADVLIESYATGVAERLGIGAEEMRTLNPRLIYCSISGFGRTGPLKDGLGYDVILQAFSGILAAPLERHRTGQGCRLEAHLMRDPGYDPVRDFAPVTLTSIARLVLMVRSDFPARDITEFVTEAKARAGALNYGTGNIGSLAAAQLLISRTGVSAERISYRGTPAAVTDLLAGRLHFMVSDLASAGEHVPAGTLRALGVTPAQRIPMLPDVPTLQEAGVPGYDFTSWVAVFLPARSPDIAAARLNREIRAVLDSEEGRRFSLSLGLVSSTGTPDHLTRFQAREIEQWGCIAQAANLPRE